MTPYIKYNILKLPVFWKNWRRGPLTSFLGEGRGWPWSGFGQNVHQDTSVSKKDWCSKIFITRRAKNGDKRSLKSDKKFIMYILNGAW